MSHKDKSKQPSGVVLSDEELWSIRNQVAINEVLRDDDSVKICVKHGRAIEQAVLARLNSSPASAGDVLTSSECACGDQYPANSYGAGFMAANNGVCENCDAANSCGLGVVDERAAFETWLSSLKFVSGQGQAHVEYCLHRDLGDKYTTEWVSDMYRGWQARAALSAPSHGEQVRDGWRLVPVEPTRAMRYSVENTSLASAVTRQSTQHEIGVQVYAAMLAAAPSAGIQVGDV